ncbi:hypothetical protein [Methylogaea oryzae]|nr:hypothetical protein [Methylogaea oryzae]
MTALQLPAPLGKPLIRYLALFRPATRDLSWDRVATLLGELLPMIQAAQIQRDGVAWSAPLEVWAAALEEMQQRHAKKPFNTPLKSHGYLLEIIAGKGEKAAAKKEAQREERRRERPEGKRANRTTSVADAVSGLRGALKGEKP